MPRYYFDIDDGQRQFHDEDGSDLPNLRAARAEAVGILPHIAEDIPLDGDNHDMTTSVRNETGDIVLTARLSLVNEDSTSPLRR